MDIPVIGKTKGIFEIFVPGVFILINIIVVLYLLSQSVNSFEFLDNILKKIALKPSLLIIILICFGYLIGIWNVLSRYRFIRIKEAQTLFDAWYKNKELFLRDSCVKLGEDVEVKINTS